MKKLILLLPFVLFACKSEGQKEIERLEAEQKKAHIEVLKAEEQLKIEEAKLEKMKEQNK